MDAQVFTTVRKLTVAGESPTLHVSHEKGAYYVPLCGTRTNPKKLIVASATAAEITCERCLTMLRKEGLI